MKNRPDKLAQLAALVANDGWAMTFQSLGQYRTALLKEIARLNQQPERLLNAPESCCSGCCMARQVTLAAGGAL